MSANAGSVESTSRLYAVETERSLTEAIVEAVAEVSGRPSISPDGDRDSLDPLYHAIDADALEALCASAPGTREGDVSVSFSYEDCRVTVHSYGVVRAEPMDELGG